MPFVIKTKKHTRTHNTQKKKKQIIIAKAFVDCQKHTGENLFIHKNPSIDSVFIYTIIYMYIQCIYYIIQTSQVEDTTMKSLDCMYQWINPEDKIHKVVPHGGEQSNSTCLIANTHIFYGHVYILFLHSSKYNSPTTTINTHTYTHKRKLFMIRT